MKNLLQKQKLNLAWLAWSLLTMPVFAAPPKVDYCFPAGGQRGQSVTTTLSGTFAKWPVQIWTDRKDVQVNAGKKKGEVSFSIHANALPGVCRFRVYDDQGASDLKAFIIGTVPELLEQNPNNDTNRPHDLKTLPVVINGKLEANNDVDVYSFDLKKGETLIAALEANHTLKSPMDGILQVLSENGFVLEQNDDLRGIDPRIVYTAKNTGKYFVRLFSFPATPTSSISFAGGASFVYRLTLTTGPFADHCMPLAINKEDTQTPKLVGWNIPERMAVQVSNGVVFADRLANICQVRQEPHATIVESQKNRMLSIPVTVSGCIEKEGEQDIYQFHAKKGEALQIKIEANGMDSPLDPVLQWRDASDKLVKEVFSKQLWTDPELTISTKTDGLQKIYVSDLHGRGGSNFVYRLRITKAEPEFSASLKGDAFVVTLGKSLEIPITVERRNGFSKPLKVTCIDLPNGVTAKTLEISAKAKTAKLELVAEKAGPAGPFQMIVMSDNGAKKEMVSAPAAALESTTTSLWITAVPPAKKKSK